MLDIAALPLIEIGIATTRRSETPLCLHQFQDHEIITQFEVNRNKFSHYPPASMFSVFDQVPTSTSLLMQCGYRSKVCTNHRATKIDGTLHKLCEFHRRKANLNQQRLHKRKREERAVHQMHESVKYHPVKKARPSLEPIVDTIFYFKREVATNETSEYAPTVGGGGAIVSKFGSPDMDFLELLLSDMQSLPPLESFQSSTLTTATRL